MPVISRFLGITILMFHREHGPPHFHAWYGGKEISVEIRTGKVNGSFSSRAQALVLDWWRAHRVELEDNWRRAQRLESLVWIEPLE